MAPRNMCPYERPISIVGDRWVLRIVKTLHTSERPLRFNQLMSELEPVSSKTLSVKLKQLMEQGIVTKSIMQLTPIVATYDLTEKGHDLMHVLEAMSSWGERWHVAEN